MLVLLPPSLRHSSLGLLCVAPGKTAQERMGSHFHRDVYVSTIPPCSGLLDQDLSLPPRGRLQADKSGCIRNFVSSCHIFQKPFGFYSAFTDVMILKHVLSTKHWRCFIINTSMNVQLQLRCIQSCVPAALLATHDRGTLHDNYGQDVFSDQICQFVHSAVQSWGGRVEGDLGEYFSDVSLLLLLWSDGGSFIHWVT